MVGRISTRNSWPQLGVHAVWNDMNEPAVMEVPTKTAPLDTRHHYDGYPCSHQKAHNVYGMQMVRATYEGVKKYVYPEKTDGHYQGRPTRAHSAFASTWTGRQCGHVGTPLDRQRTDAADVHERIFVLWDPISGGSPNSPMANCSRDGFS